METQEGEGTEFIVQLKIVGNGIYWINKIRGKYFYPNHLINLINPRSDYGT